MSPPSPITNHLHSIIYYNSYNLVFVMVSDDRLSVRCNVDIENENKMATGDGGGDDGF